MKALTLSKVIPQMNSPLPFSSLPTWFVFIATLMLSLLSVEFGYRRAKKRQLRTEQEEEREKEAPVGAMVGTTLGLLAFLLAFTFGMAADAFHARKMALLEETNAVRITYRLAGVIPEPHRTDVRQILREYVEDRLHWVGLDKAQESIAATVLLDRLWAHAVAVGAQSPGGVDEFLGSVVRVTEVRAERETVRERSRIPNDFWLVLYLLAILSLWSMGYHGGVAGTVRSPVMIAVAISFSLVMVLIADVDSPGHGIVNVSQQPMVDLRNWLVAESKR
jgi:hypothetical protein